MTCPCCSGRLYLDCCKIYHDQLENPPTPLALMRSRYSAYAKGLADYIIQTTHPDSPYFEKDRTAWKRAIQTFCKTTEFLRLEIVDSGDNWVHFIAYLKQKTEFPLEEKSLFQQLDGKWLYVRAL